MKATVFQRIVSTRGAMRLLGLVLVVHLAFLQGYGTPQSSIHIVSTDDLRNELVSQARTREANLAEIRQLFQHTEVREQLKHLVDLNQIDQALPTLDDETLAYLAQESRKANDQLRAGLSTGATIAIAVAVAVGVFFLILAIVWAVSDD